MTNATQSEVWKAIPGHDGYEASSLGRIRSIDRFAWNNGGRVPHEVFLRGRVLSQHSHKGYKYVSLGASFRTQVHILVALAFIGERPEDHDCCHNDGNSANNHADNLRYDTRSENILDSVRHGTHHESSKTHCKRGHLLVDPNLRKKEGGRGQCRSCLFGVKRASGSPRRSEESVQRRSDQKYRLLMNGLGIAA